LSLSGVECPRDSDQQRASLGTELPADTPLLQRGDLIFFPGHVGFMADGVNLLHANAWWMAVTIEPLKDVIDRLRRSHEQPVSAVRRITA
jgi:cell wall-associated NlpC family hydrolase